MLTGHAAAVLAVARTPGDGLCLRVGRRLSVAALHPYVGPGRVTDEAGRIARAGKVNTINTFFFLLIRLSTINL